jgi:hypothetical protein
MKQRNRVTLRRIKTDIEMDPPYNGVGDTNQGNDMQEAPEEKPTNQTIQPAPRIGKKRLNQRTSPSTRKKKKA